MGWISYIANDFALLHRVAHLGAKGGLLRVFDLLTFGIKANLRRLVDL